jgi:hypothetical protein
VKKQFGPSVLRSSFVLSLALSAMVASTAHASTIVYTANFGSVTDPTPDPTGNSFLLGFDGGSVTGWTSAGYNFVYTTALQATTSGIHGGALSNSTSPLGYNTVSMWNVAAAPDSNSFLALDSDYEPGAVSTTVSGLTVGATETVSFYMAGAQQNNYTGASTDMLAVTMSDVGGAQSVTKDTPVISVLSEGFTGWDTESVTFTATATSETLSFLASGTPSNNVPAFALLDDLSISQTTRSATPEPSSLMLLSTGLMGLGGFVRSRIKNS